MCNREGGLGYKVSNTAPCSDLWSTAPSRRPPQPWLSSPLLAVSSDAQSHRCSSSPPILPRFAHVSTCRSWPCPFLPVVLVDGVGGWCWWYVRGDVSRVT